MGYSFVAGYTGLTSIILIQFVPKFTEIGEIIEITNINCHTPFKVIHGTDFGMNWKAAYTSYCTVY